MQKVYKLSKVQDLLEYLAHEMNPRTISMSSTEPVNTRIYIKIAQPIRNRANIYRYPQTHRSVAKSNSH